MPATLSQMLRLCIRMTPFSLVYISQSTGVPVSTLSRFVNGKRGLNQESIDKLYTCFFSHLGNLSNDKTIHICFNRMMEIEPELSIPEHFVNTIRRKRRPKTFCAIEFWLDRVKPLIVAKVGYYAEKAALQNSDAYDVAYSYLWELMPGCGSECALHVNL